VNGPSVLDPRPNCPEIEALAAFAEGRLAGAERTALVAHVADCEACREIVAETRALAAETHAAAGSELAAGEVVPFRRPARAGNRRRALLATAAALTVAVAGILWLRPGPPSAGSALAELGGDAQTLARLGGDWTEPLWSVTRGDGPVVSEAARAFRLGVRSADLELALAADDRRAARRVATESALLVGDVPLADPVAHLYRELARRAGEPAEPLPALADDAATAAALARDAVDLDLWQLGRWSEVGRLAATAGVRVGLPRPPLAASLPAELADLARRAARPELDAPLVAQAAAFAELVARGGDLR
jgi:hypothetical protein